MRWLVGRALAAEAAEGGRVGAAGAAADAAEAREAAGVWQIGHTLRPAIETAGPRYPQEHAMASGTRSVRRPASGRRAAW